MTCELGKPFNNFTVTNIQSRSSESARFTYHVGRWALESNLSLPVLHPFAAAGCIKPDIRVVAQSKKATDSGEGTTFFSGSGWIGNSDRDVGCRTVPDGYELRVAGVGVFAVDADGGRIIVVEQDGDAALELVAEVIVGPALILAMALLGTFCLHASAVEVDGEAVLLVGESGAGKSTLGDQLARAGVGRRIADDVLPLTIEEGRAFCYPHYPQLKLSAEEQIASTVPERIPVLGIYNLQQVETTAAVLARRPEPREIVRRLIGHTVAARLFDARLLANHLRFCSALASTTRFFDLCYPHRCESIPEVLRLLRDQPQGRPGEGG